MRRLSITIAVLVCLFHFGFFNTTVHASDDITGHFFEMQMRTLDELGIMKGDGLGSYFPDKNVTRAQFATFLNRALKLPNANDAMSFSDTKGHVHEHDINNAVAAGIINGIGDGRFLPDRVLTREEVAVMVSRVLVANGLNADSKPLPFVDFDKFRYPNESQPVFYYSIMGGNSDQTFRPADSITRAQTAAVIYKMYNLLEVKAKEKEEQDIIKEPIPDDTGENDPSKLDQDLDLDEDYEGKDIIVVANRLLYVYEEGMKRTRTYVNAGTEMKFLDKKNNEIQVEVAGATGFVKREEVDLILADEAVRSYYKIDRGDLRHYIARNGQYESYVFGKVPSFIKEGEKAYSFDGKSFDNGTFYQYFNYLPLLTETSYSALELDQYVQSQSPDSPLIGLGKTFKQAEEETGVNALYLLAHAIHESQWGKSKIATEKFNLYGIRAIDADAFNSAMEFASFEDCIIYAANYVKAKYLQPGPGSYYGGSFLGNKGVGVNLFYASDPYWGQKIAGYMYRIDRALGNQDWNEYELAISTVPSLNIRSGPSTSEHIQYEHQYAGVTMVVLDVIKKNDGIWYKIKSDHPNYEEAYIYASGEKGTLAEIIN